MNNWQIHDALQMKSLVIQFQRRATHTTHVCFVPFPQMLVIAYGISEQGRFIRIVQNQYRYDNHLELLNTHDGIGWNIPLLMGFLAECLHDELEEDALQMERESKE
ncbi:MAG: hypothetical protein K8L97_25170 [Anaerolineae bacterium]|nr:hypothetical protein [Anaerolineae bacterium]